MCWKPVCISRCVLDTCKGRFQIKKSKKWWNFPCWALDHYLRTCWKILILPPELPKHLEQDQKDLLKLPLYSLLYVSYIFPWSSLDLTLPDLLWSLRSKWNACLVDMAWSRLWLNLNQVEEKYIKINIYKKYIKIKGSRLCFLVNVEAEVEKKYREKILYKNISGLSKCTGTGTGTGTTWTKLCI